MIQVTRQGSMAVMRTEGLLCWWWEGAGTPSGNGAAAGNGAPAVPANGSGWSVCVCVCGLHDLNFMSSEAVEELNMSQFSHVGHCGMIVLYDFTLYCNNASTRSVSRLETTLPARSVLAVDSKQRAKRAFVFTLCFFGENLQVCGSCCSEFCDVKLRSFQSILLSYSSI